MQTCMHSLHLINPKGVDMVKNKEVKKEDEIIFDFMTRDAFEFAEIEESCVDKAMILTSNARGKANCL